MHVVERMLRVGAHLRSAILGHLLPVFPSPLPGDQCLDLPAFSNLIVNHSLLASGYIGSAATIAVEFLSEPQIALERQLEMFLPMVHDRYVSRHKQIGCGD